MATISSDFLIFIWFSRKTEQLLFLCSGLLRFAPVFSPFSRLLVCFLIRFQPRRTAPSLLCLCLPAAAFSQISPFLHKKGPPPGFVFPGQQPLLPAGHIKSRRFYFFHFLYLQNCLNNMNISAAFPEYPAAGRTCSIV